MSEWNTWAHGPTQGQAHRGRGSRVLAGVGVLAAGVAVGVLAGCGVAGTYPTEGSLPGAPVPAPSAQALPQQTFCQWSWEGRQVVVFGDGVSAFRVRFRSGTVTSDVPNRSGRQWVGIRLSGTAEDDVRVVSCKVGGAWRLAEPS